MSPHVAADVLALEHVEVGHRHGGGHRVAGEGEAVGERLVALHERRGDPVGGDHPAHRHIGGGERLGDGHDVGLVAVALAAEPVAEPAPGADHLVGDQQHVVAVADLAHALEVAVLRRDAAAGVLERLEDHRGDGVGVLVEDLLLDLVGRPERIAIGRPPVAVRVRAPETPRGQAARTRGGDPRCRLPPGRRGWCRGRRSRG